jgi:hypothetical protein
MLALEALGIPAAQCLDERSTGAMWADANINYTQQRIIKKHLQQHFGKCLFIPDSTFNIDHEQYYVPTFFSKSIGITKMETRHRSWNNASTGVVILV